MKPQIKTCKSCESSLFDGFDGDQTFYCVEHDLCLGVDHDGKVKLEANDQKIKCDTYDWEFLSIDKENEK